MQLRGIWPCHFPRSVNAKQGGFMAPRKARNHTTETQESNVGTQELPPETVSTPGTETEERKPFPPLRSWQHDNQAGVERLTYSHKGDNHYETQLRFRDGKPSDAVRKAMKDAGFRWAGDAPQGGVFNVEGAWVRPHNINTVSQDRLAGERVYREVRDMMLKEKGIEAPAQEQGREPF
jgi:hypothetical protein